jgi:small conductance mechanosensitive channel
MQEFVDKLVGWLLTSGIRIAVILILMFIAMKIAKALTFRVLRRKSKVSDPELIKRIDTVGGVIAGLLTVAILIMAMVMILGEFGISIGPILAGVGIVGVALGFGAQHLVKDVINGIFILLDDQIRIGDVVEVAGKAGVVEKVNLRLTVLRDLAGNVHYVNNGNIGVVTNMTKDYSRYVFEIGVAYRESFDEVVEVVKQVDEEIRSDPQFADDILEPIEILGLDKFADSAVIIKARVKTRPIKQWSIGREYNRRLKQRFDEKGIEIPFPHMTLYMGQDKQGDAPALNVAMQKQQ